MARSAKAVPWFLFAAGGTVIAFILPVMIFVTGLAPAMGLFGDALSYETMHAFVGNWLIKLILLGIIVLAAWHAAHGCGSAPTTSAFAPMARSPSSSTASPPSHRPRPSSRC